MCCIHMHHGTISSKFKKIQLNTNLSNYHSHKTILNAANQISIYFLHIRIRVFIQLHVW